MKIVHVVGHDNTVPYNEERKKLNIKSRSLLLLACAFEMSKLSSKENIEDENMLTK